MQYAAARHRNIAEAAAFRVYVADTLYYYTHNKAIDVRYSDWITVDDPEKETDADPEEIINSMKDKLERLVNK